MLKKNVVNVFLFVISILILPTLLLFPQPGQAFVDVSVAEGVDFATQVMGDPWDMSEYFDVSQYINQSGNNINLSNIQVANGIFSARTTTTDSWFYPLFPGYETAMQIGKIGNNYPIDSAKYQCLYVAAKIDSAPKSTGSVPDTLRVFYFADERLNGPGEDYFGVSAVVLDDFNRLSPTQQWKVFKINMVTNNVGLKKWDARPTWAGVRINPSDQNNTNFAVDWIRLTNCKEVTLPLSGLTPNLRYAFYVVSADGREILVEGFTPTSFRYSVDLQGVAAGSYTYRVKQNGSVVQTGTVNVNQAPIVKFTRPSTTSGVDYATSQGNPWDFNDSSDVSLTQDLWNESFSGGLFNFNAPNGAPGAFDSIIRLNTPSPLSSAGKYRYLTVKMRTDGAWQNVPGGMIGRWIWHIPISGGAESCWMVSHDIPYDIGWYTITVDLFDSFNEDVEQKAGNCSGQPDTWAASSNVSILRFDPAENETSAPFVQAIDSITLTAVDEAKKGSLFPISFSVNKAKSAVAMTYYYTTSRSAPTQNAAVIRLSGTNPQPTGNYRIYMPSVVNRQMDPAAGSADALWDTTTVPTGTYYLCAQANDGLNTTLFCSEAPVKVVP